MQLVISLRPAAGVRLALGIACGLLAGAVPAQNGPASDGEASVVAHGLSAFGELGYPADFAHFDYVNPQAPKGGILSHTGYGASETFDTFNPYIIKGTAPEGLVLTSTDGGGNLTYDSLMVAAADERVRSMGWWPTRSSIRPTAPGSSSGCGPRRGFTTARR
jgi:microcin C transport system substrate-binding protein